MKQPCRDYVQKALETVCLIHKTNTINGDVLVFLTGFEEIDRFVKLFSALQADGTLKDDIFVLPLYAGLGVNKQMDVFKPAPYGKSILYSLKSLGKVIVATNIAETSITIDNVVYVIDCCFVKMRFFDPVTGTSAALTSRHGKSCCCTHFPEFLRSTCRACWPSKRYFKIIPHE